MIGCGHYAHRALNLKGWISEPYVRDAVLAVLARAEQSLLLREIAMECEHPISSVNRVLGRLHKKGMVSRYKLPVQGHPQRYGHKPCLLCKATRMLYAYSIASALEG